MKVFLIYFLALSLLLFPVLPIKTTFAAPRAGYVVNDKSKICTLEIIGDESMDLNLGNCKIKVFEENLYDSSPKEVCEAHGYTFSKGDIKTFCQGSNVGNFEPINNNTPIDYIDIMTIVVILFTSMLISALIAVILHKLLPAKRKPSLKKLFLIILLLVMFMILFGIISDNLKLYTIKQE